ncbi:MAG: bidirectional hydrogenase complex protein HoxE [Anaerolineae bacterium]|nr:bidirectional hydrogenase complex protein HoxE [Anaerolineae bacterium]
MVTRFKDIAPPSEDKRWRLVNATMRRHGNSPNALIETLHTVQESFGFLDETSLRYVSACLQVPLSQTYGVATFYHFFQLKPGGRHSCVVCVGTACYIKGSVNVLDTISEKFGVNQGETTDDGELSLLTARCIGSCGLAPAIVLDNTVIPKMTPKKAVESIEEAIEHGS